jgi:hypothetical protein
MDYVKRERGGGNRWEEEGGLKAVKECEGRTAKMERTCERKEYQERPGRRRGVKCEWLFTPG